MASSAPQHSGRTGLGLAFALGAFVAWGLAPAYFKQLSAMDVWELLFQRILWSIPFVFLLAWRVHGLKGIAPAMGGWGRWKVYAASTALVTVNWGVYIWAVGAGRVMEISLGYYINPLVNVSLAILFLGERLNRRQWTSVGLAACGVTVLSVGLGALPLASLGLAFAWGFYALVRTRARIDPIAGLLVETLAVAPVALAFLAWRHAEGLGAFGQHGIAFDLLVVGSGVVTALPQMLFMYAARHMAFSMLGLVGYLSPTLQLLVAVWYGEPFTAWHAGAFALIWAGLAVYSWDALRPRRTAEAAG
jgi:chloramphenicol-sensitive protein RarD